MVYTGVQRSRYSPLPAVGWKIATPPAVSDTTTSLAPSPSHSCAMECISTDAAGPYNAFRVASATATRSAATVRSTSPRAPASVISCRCSKAWATSTSEKTPRRRQLRTSSRIVGDGAAPATRATATTSIPGGTVAGGESVVELAVKRAGGQQNIQDGAIRYSGLEISRQRQQLYTDCQPGVQSQPATTACF